MLSIIVVCFNEQNRIGRTLNSIFEQTYQNIDCMIVDGGSRDGTLEIIEEYKKKFSFSGIKVRVISEKDQGIFDAMNKGIRNAEGNWIYFLNAGDSFHGKDAVEAVMRQLDDRDEIIIGRIVFWDGYLGKVIEHSPLEELKRDMIFCHQAVFAKRELLKSHCFDIFYRYCADYEWLLAMYLEGKRIHCIDSVVADYDGNGVSSKNRDASKEEIHQIQKKYGLLVIERETQQISKKYKLYKNIGKFKRLSSCFYFLYGKRKNYYFDRTGK